MSNADKTREMLVNSMVKTKSGSEAKPAAKASAGAASKPAATTAKKKTAKKKAVTRRTPAKARVHAKLSGRAQPAADPFQSKGRIWPD